MLQTKQQDIGRPMDIQIINNGVEPLALCWDPRLDVPQEVYPVMDRATKIVFGQSRPSSWTKRPEDVALTTSSIINLLRGPGCRSWRCSGGFCAYQLLSRITLGSDWPHLIQANYRTMLRGVGVERFNEPLFFANSGSTRSPNQVSCVRQRSPSAISNASIRMRLIAICFSSLRYVASRSSVQHANGWLSWRGSVKAVAMTSATCSGWYVTGRPARGRSCKPSSPASLKRLSQVRTVVSVSSSACAIAGTRFPISASRIRRARSTSRAGAVRERANFSIADCSAAVNFFNLSAIAGLL